MNVRTALQTVLDQVDYTDGACTVTEMVGATLPEEVIAQARAALAAPFGLTVDQESKYTVNDEGRIINRATGVAIPDDEPIIIFRAKDVHTRATSRRYYDLILETGSLHAQSCFERYQRFIAFAERHPERMRKPD